LTALPAAVRAIHQARWSEGIESIWRAFCTGLLHIQSC